MSMKATKLFRLIPVFVLFFCLLTACSDDDNARLSSFEEATLEGEASTLEISFTHGDWRIASVTDLNGYPPVGGTTLLEGLGTVNYGWADIKREKQNALLIEAKDNFDGEERGFIIDIEMKTGFYKEQIIIRQQPCENFYRIESIVYSVEEGDGVTEAETQFFKDTFKDTTIGNATIKRDWYPFINVFTDYEFLLDNHSTEVFRWIDPKESGTPLPERIEDGKVILGKDVLPFTAWSQYYKENELKYKSYEVELVGMKWNIYTGTIYCKRLQVTFVLTLSRPGSDAKEVFKGKFRLKYPYDCSPIHHEVRETV